MAADKPVGERVSAVEARMDGAERGHGLILDKLDGLSTVAAKISATQDAIVSRLAEGRDRMNEHDEKFNGVHDRLTTIETTARNTRWATAGIAGLVSAAAGIAQLFGLHFSKGGLPPH